MSPTKKHIMKLYDAVHEHENATDDEMPEKLDEVEAMVELFLQHYIGDWIKQHDRYDSLESLIGVVNNS